MSAALVAGLVVGSLLVGALVTSYAEYHFQYNLYDYIVEGLKKVFGVAKAEADTAQALGAAGETAVRAAVADAKAVEKKL